MDKVISQQEIDGFKSSVKEISEAVQKLQKRDEGITEQISQAVKDVLASHPGVTAERKIQFGGQNSSFTPEVREKRIFDRMAKEAPHLVEACDGALIVAAMTKQPVKNLKYWQILKEDLGDFKKALDSTTAGGIDEWVPTSLSGQFYELVRLQQKVVTLFPTVNMPTNPYTPPIQIGKIKTFKQPEQTADTGQTKIPVGDTESISDVLTFNAIGHASRVLFSDEATEDSIVPILPFLRAEMIKAVADGQEDAILNGDTAGSHEDSDITDADDRRKLFLGLRAHANDQSYKTDLSTFNGTNLSTIRSRMGKYGVNPRDLGIVTGISGYIKLMDLPEVITVDKYGAGATILNGELANYRGIPIIVSEWIREVLNSSGVYASGQTKTALHFVYRNGFALGRKGGTTVRVLTELYAESGQQALITKERIAFSPIYPIASNRTTEMGHNFSA